MIDIKANRAQVKLILPIYMSYTLIQNILEENAYILSLKFFFFFLNLNFQKFNN